ncbi:GLPGLI family protein [Sphingobacterium deserti]|uniref:GLPGLI family protein n=1 Tax=Sphingobacterium deserti TaxID=1229276 RepID=A0A0B8T6W2_9SPHI|nr:GLPGLI family protein [Sphingobacterium deserti]KGE13989.1 protein of unknown function, Porph ging [Sphingobacterium deserti]
MIKIVFTSITLVCSLLSGLYAQNAYFPTKGKIRFEREVYLRARIREMSNKASGENRGMMMRYNSNVNDIPEKNSSFFMLQFDETTTLMSAVEEETAATTSTPSRGQSRGGRRPSNGRPERMGRSAMRGGSPDKIFHQNLAKGSSLLQMELDEKYLLEDSLQQITWRFTDEYREIAGYECRRVNGATPDSLYIVAFYTDQIPVSGGPALVHGLPGMILGLAIPEMHINYWAQKVDFLTDNVPQDWKDKKAKEMNMQELFESLGKNRFYGGGNNRNQIKRNLLENLIY